VSQVITKASAHPCLLQHYSQESSYGNSQEWIKKMWYLYTTEFYSVTKNKILSFTDKWMELENIILSEVSQAQMRTLDLKQMQKYYKTLAALMGGCIQEGN
jgi:hypothetical protein